MILVPAVSLLCLLIIPMMALVLVSDSSILFHPSSLTADFHSTTLHIYIVELLHASVLVLHAELFSGMISGLASAELPWDLFIV